MVNPEVTHKEQDLSHLLLDFNKLSEGQKSDLQDLVHQRHGWVEIWVHSHFDEDVLQASLASGPPQALLDYYSARQRSINHLRKTKRLPVLAFISEDSPEQPKLDFIKEYQVDQASQPVYYIQTIDADPTPVGGAVQGDFFSKIHQINMKDQHSLTSSDFDFISAVLNKNLTPKQLEQMTQTEWDQLTNELHWTATDLYQRAEQANWSSLFQKLRQLGVKGAVIKGRNYFVFSVGHNLSPIDEKYRNFHTNRALNDDEYPGGCVGEVCKRMVLEGFKIRFSKATFPYHPSKELKQAYKKIEPNLSQNFNL